MRIEEACELYNISVDEFLAWESATSTATAFPVCAPRDIRFIAIPKCRNGRAEDDVKRRRARRFRATKKRFMRILFWICRDEEQERWLVLIEDQVYGEYLDEETAVHDAIDLANDARVIGNAAEVWHRSNTSRLY